MGCSSSRTIEDQPSEPVRILKSKTPSIKIETKMLSGKNNNAIMDSYTIVGKLGQGNFGKVYEVIHKLSKQRRAMKALPKGKEKDDLEDKRFLKEIDILSHIDHPHILKIFEYFEDKSYFYVVTEYAEGGELYYQLSTIQSYNETNAATIIQQLLSCVSYLHANAIVHRDIKPDNIILDMANSGELSIKLIDFGVANFDKRGKNSRLKAKVGSLYYKAPEVIKQDYDSKCDIWSVGVIMYVLLCGYPPFDGDNDEIIINKINTGNYNFEGKEWKKISEEAKSLIRKMLTINPVERICANDALKDVWLLTNRKALTPQGSPKTKHLTFSNLRRFNSSQKLQEASIAYLVHQIASEDKVKDLRVIFQKMDLSGTGRLSYEDLRAGWNELSCDPTISDKEFEELISLMDRNGDQYIEYEEFLRATVNIDVIFTERNLKMAFEYFDLNKSGKLSFDDIKNVMCLITDDQSATSIIKGIISRHDTNGDGLLTYEDFKDLMIDWKDKTAFDSKASML